MCVYMVDNCRLVFAFIYLDFKNCTPVFPSVIVTYTLQKSLEILLRFKREKFISTVVFYFQCLQKPNLTTDTKDKEYKPHDIPQRQSVQPSETCPPARRAKRMRAEVRASWGWAGLQPSAGVSDPGLRRACALHRLNFPDLTEACRVYASFCTWRNRTVRGARSWGTPSRFMLPGPSAAEWLAVRDFGRIGIHCDPDDAGQSLLGVKTSRCEVKDFSLRRTLFFLTKHLGSR